MSATDFHGNEIIKHDLVRDNSGELVEVINVQNENIRVLVNGLPENRDPNTIEIVQRDNS
jgi:hypothetical protein